MRNGLRRDGVPLGASHFLVERVVPECISRRNQGIVSEKYLAGASAHCWKIGATAELFWLSDEQWAVIGPFMPTNQPGTRRLDDRRILPSIVQVLKSESRWQDCPDAYGLPTTVYNRFNRWSRRGFWRAMLAAVAEAGWAAEAATLERSHVKARRGSKGGRCAEPSARRATGQTLSVRVPADVTGRSAALHLTPGNAADVTAVPAHSGLRWAACGAHRRLRLRRSPPARRAERKRQ